MQWIEILLIIVATLFVLGVITKAIVDKIQGKSKCSECSECLDGHNCHECKKIAKQIRKDFQKIKKND